MKQHKNTNQWMPVLGCTLVLGLFLAAAPASGDVACPGDLCDNRFQAFCDEGGFQVRLKTYLPAPTSNSGSASYTYEICNPPEGVCTGDNKTKCKDNGKCTQGGNPAGGVCTRRCAVDEFRDLSHFDIGLPSLGAGSCLKANTQITGSCNPAVPFSVGQDGSCGNAFVAKCDNTNLAFGQCLEMTINIPGELNKPGVGEAFSISKESGDCNKSCLAGPSCEPCDGVPPGKECLTRTRGFWGTHPHLIQSNDARSLDLLPITVCGKVLNTVDAGVCSTSEALCTNNADRKSNPTYLTLAAQLAAAKLNLAATAKVSEGGACSDWVFGGMGIQDWIAHCEPKYCTESKQAISASGCIEALDDFNNSQDVGFDQTPAPFHRPGPALVEQCQLARGNGIFVGVGAGGCTP